jgi:hypothetical protein
MRIGILTFCWSEDNYGQILQCYALQKYLRDAGYQAFLINYDYRQDYPKLSQKQRFCKALNPKELVRFIFAKVKNYLVEKEYQDNNRQFSCFKEKYIKQSEKTYKHYSELKIDPPIADIYIVGSDQVWNYTFYPLRGREDVLKAQMLDFGPEEVKRMSYAASWGIKEIDKELIPQISKLLSKFSYVSVREQNGVELCSQCGVNTAEWVSDPTLLLNAEIYRKLYNENEIRKPERPYILLYMLNNKFSFRIQSIYEYAQNKNLDIVYVTGNGVIDKYKKFFATIPEWLYLIDNADYVITNSFHCSVFSLIFQKQFGVVKLEKEHEGMNMRFDSLFTKAQISPRYVSDNDFSVLTELYQGNNVQSTADNLLKAINVVFLIKAL